MNGNTFGKRTRFSIFLMICVSLLICSVFIGTVSASGSSSGGSGGSSEVTYSSTTLFTNWALVHGDYYDAVLKNPTSCVSKVIVVLPKKPSSATVDYLSYAIAKYSDMLTTKQKSALIDPLGLIDPETGMVTRTTIMNPEALPADSLEELIQLQDIYANSLPVSSSTPVTGWVLDEEGEGI